MAAQAIPLRAVCTCARSSGVVRQSRSISTSLQRLSKATASTSSSSGSTPPTPLSISSAKPGTVLTGLSIYKDRADPIAGPDESYPSWLWGLTDLTADAAGGSASSAGTLASRGDARVAAKREAKISRQEAAAKARAEERMKARAEVIAARQAERGISSKSANTGPKVKAISEEERERLRESKWRKKVDEKHTELRKKNKAAIKASNFVKAS